MTEPRWMKLARTDMGLRETPGIANNPVLMKRFAPLTKLLGMFYNADSVPWCGAIMAWWMNQCGIKPPLIAVRAKSWATWQANIAPERIAVGAVLVFQREGGGHVGLYAGEDATHYFVLGGNQSDAVSLIRIAKSRCIARRWPRGEAVIGKPLLLDARGVPVGRSEA